jgi:hypothetical protein
MTGSRRSIPERYLAEIDAIIGPPKRGRRMGSAKFTRFDHIIVQIANLREGVPVKAAVRAVVQEIWDQAPAR